MAKRYSIELHNEEVREIMKEIPRSLIRWGLTIIFLIFASIIIGSYFFQFKEIVSVPIIITSTNPPAPIISKASGRITHWFVSDGQIVNKGGNIALVKNSITLEDFLLVESIIFQLDSSKIIEILDKVVLPEKLALGELQNDYNQLYNHLENYRDFIESNFLHRKIVLLRQQIEKQRQHFQLTLLRQKKIEDNLDMTRKEVRYVESMLNKVDVSEAQIDESRRRCISLELGHTNFMDSLKIIEIDLISQKLSLLELLEQHNKETKQFELNILDDIRSFKSQLEYWRDKYLLSSPIRGTVSLSTSWSENHVVTAGERLATVVPCDSSEIVCRAIVNSSGIGKVEIGQQVNIKLSGFPFMEFGILVGKVSTISLVPEKEGYIAEIELTSGMTSSYSEQLKFIQEMDGTADIVTSEMRLIYRFINPLKMLFDRGI